MSEAATPLDALDESEHQALDLLDELRCGADWNEPEDLEARARLDAALAELGEDRGALDEAATIALPALARIVALVARNQLEAAQRLAATEHRGDLDPGLVDAALAQIDAEPAAAAALAPAVESAGVFLGLTRDSVAWAVLLVLGERADAAASDALRRGSEALAERLAAAWPSPAPAASPASPAIPDPLRAFRSATVRLAGPELRARALAAEHPDRLDLALGIVRAHAGADVDVLLATFDQARTALEPEADDDPAASIDGPKRRFTLLHLILAAIVLGLTLWHYVWR